MTLFFKLLFFISLAGIIHTYLVYPLLMLLLRSFQKPTPAIVPASFPTVEIIFAAYNEESVIEEKIRTAFATLYPSEKLRVRVGSDHSTDRTDSIIRELQKEFPRLLFRPFPQRTGKSGVINELVKESEAELLVLTDANILFRESTVGELVCAITADDRTGAVGGNIEYRNVLNKGISKQEQAYLQIENRVKSAESKIFGAAFGLEGGCYIIRRELFPVIPPLFFMEDFFVSLSVLEQRYKVMFAENALCYEDVSVERSEEFKRKVRISIGNFQNLQRFHRLIFRYPLRIGLPFLSHKVLRWHTPFFLVFLFISAIALSAEGTFYSLFAGFYCLFLSAGLLGILFSHSKGVSLLKYPGHFIHMNIALLKGFFIYLKGVQSNVWQPTSRNQK